MASERWRDFRRGAGYEGMGESVISSVMLVCAVVASLGVGVLAAHWVVVGLFAMFRTHAKQVASARVAAKAGTAEVTA
jgi:hypothetical protein